MSEHETPLAIYLPVDIDAEGRGAWCEAVFTDLAGAKGGELIEHDAWLPLLDAAASEPIPEGASGSILLVSAALPPTYLWVTAAQPAGHPTQLGDAILDTQLVGPRDANPPATASSRVFQRSRGGWVEQDDDQSLFLQTSVTATTLAIPGLGPVDVCLWFNSSNPVGAEELQPAIAEIALSPDLVTYLST